tara:strand:- start:900 stop:1562 length:663 start_codon:yes stop_codon:yes gene_type:complete
MYLFKEYVVVSIKSNMDSPIASTILAKAQRGGGGAVSTPPGHRVAGRKEILLDRLKKYYSADNSSKATIVKNVVCGNTVLSLRIIDWFVTNYSRDYNIKYLKRGDMFCVYSDYKNQLKAFSKKMFDPFCRRERETIEEIGETTIGQLNFFKWAIECGVIEYAICHVKEIEQNMISSQAERTIKKSKETRTDIPAASRARKTNKKQMGFLRDDIATVVKFN